MSENKTIQLDSDEQEAFVIFDVLNVPGKTRKDVSEAIRKTLHWTPRRGAIARKCGVAAKLMERGALPLSSGEAQKIAQTVGYDASSAMVSSWHRMYMLWAAQRRIGPLLETSLTVDIRRETDAPVRIPAKKTSGKLVAFRLVVIAGNPLVVEKIVLEVVRCEAYALPAGIGAFLEPIERIVELNPAEKQYEVPKVAFKYEGSGVDEVRLLCTSPPGYAYRLRIRVHYTDYPSKNIWTVTSDEFDLHFPKELKDTTDKSGNEHRRKAGKNPKGQKNANERNDPLIGESLHGGLKGLANCQDGLAENVDLQLRLYMDRELSLGDVKRIEQTLVKAGLTLKEPVGYAARIVAIRLKFTRSCLSRIADIDVPGMIGWQLFDQREMDKYQKARTTSVSNLGGKGQGGKRNLLLVE